MEHAMTARSSSHSKASSLGSIYIQFDQKWESEMEDITKMEEKKEMDPQVLMILEHVREVYIEQKGLVKRLFEGSHDDMWEVLKKIKEEVLQIRSRKGSTKVLSRSLSVGSPRRSSENDDTRLDRFKVKTLDVKQGGEGGVKQPNDRKELFRDSKFHLCDA